MENKMKVGDFEIVAKVDKFGLLHVTAKDTTSPTLIHVETNESGEFEDGSVTHSFTSNPAIVDYELRQSPGWSGKEDGRINTDLLSKVAKDPVFSAWWRDTSGDTPEQYAQRIREIRLKEGRDPATGAKRAIEPADLEEIS